MVESLCLIECNSVEDEKSLFLMDAIHLKMNTLCFLLNIIYLGQ